MTAYSARILADSVSAYGGHRLTTMEVTFPRIVLAEFNTHRMFSRNSASSRAIPVAKQIQRIQDSPFTPGYWGRNQSGMQAETMLDSTEGERATKVWLGARDDAVHRVGQLLDLQVHKQLSNRLLEPFMWQTVVVTATEWSNFFALRANPMAQPEIRTVADMMLDIYESGDPREVGFGEWHLPLIQDEERDGVFEQSEEARKISAARCARVSYLTHDGRRDLQADITLYDRLVDGGHMSPLEHVATPFTHNEWLARDELARKAKRLAGAYALDALLLSQLLGSVEFNGNFRGWTQLRKLVRNEDDFGR